MATQRRGVWNAAGLRVTSFARNWKWNGDRRCFGGSTRDVSANGFFIESPDTLWVGAGFTARLGLSEPLRVDCSVKRIEPGRGMGVAVTLPDQQHQERYQRLLSTLSCERA